MTIYRGSCPLTRIGVYGILPIHNIRMCEGKTSCLYNHLQSFHHMTARSAYKVCKAILKQRDPIVTVLFTAEEVLYNKDFHIACPFNHDARNPFDCQPKYIFKAPCSSIISRLDMPRHLRDVHHVYRACALKIVAEMRRCAKHSTRSQVMKMNRNLFDINENIIEPLADFSKSRVSGVGRCSPVPNARLFLPLAFRRGNKSNDGKARRDPSDPDIVSFVSVLLFARCDILIALFTYSVIT